MRKINWTNTLFLTITPVLGIGGTIWLGMHDAIAWQTVLFTFIMSFATGFGITAGYHRLFSHQTYEAHWSVRLVLALIGLAAFEGSALEWCADHRRHHRFVDTEKDPYNINQGFWYAHIGWLLVNDPSKRKFNNVTDLQKDPILAFQHKYNIPLSILMGIVMPILLCSFWSDAIGGFFIGAMLRITLAQHFTFCINSVCHVFGKKTYSEKQTARDNWFTAFFTFGEGFHNFHHQFPNDYRNGIRYFHYDPTKWLIYGLTKVGLAWNLKRVELKQIVSARINYFEKWFSLRESCAKTTAYYSNFFSPARGKTLSILMKLEKTAQAYQQFKNKKLAKNKYVHSYRLRKRIYRMYLKRQQKALADSMAQLSRITKRCPV